VIPRALIGFLCAIALCAPLATAGDAQLTPVNIATIRAEPVSQAMFAKHRAMFRKQGIDTTLQLLADINQTVPALLSGSADFIAMPAANLAVLKSKGAKVKAVAGGAMYDPKAPTSGLVAAKGKTIRGPRDLIGKTIAIDTPNTIAHIGVLEWLERGGVDPDDVKFTFLPFPLMMGPLEEGTVDAAFVPEPWRTVALQQYGAKHSAYPFDAVCAKRCLLTVWVAKEDVNANVVARFRNAIQAASVWANQKKNFEARRTILAKYLDLDPAVLKKMRLSPFAIRLRPAGSQPWLDLFAKQGLIPASYKAGDLVK
jgi:NitT/TauT family transport system substrate-binding protein